MADTPPDTITVIAIYNDRSGSQLAKKLSSLQQPYQIESTNEDKAINLWCYSLLDKDSFKQALDHVQRLSETSAAPKPGNEATDPACFVAACGGDGTVPAIVGALLDERKVPVFTSRVVFAVLPFGTANILARFLGWGTAMDKDYIEQLPKLLRTIVKSPVAMVDLNKITVTGLAERRHGDSDETVKEREETRYMILQVCIGLEARLGRFIERHRTRNRICNMLVSSFNVIRVKHDFAPSMKPLSSLYFFQQLLVPHPHIDRVVSFIESASPTWSPKLLASHPCIQLNFQNFPGATRLICILYIKRTTKDIAVAGGHDHSIWNASASTAEHQCIDDNRLEAFVYPCKHRYLVNNFMAAFRKESDIDALGQVELPVKITFDPTQHVSVIDNGQRVTPMGGGRIMFSIQIYSSQDLAQTYIYIDGEYLPLCPRHMSIERPGQIAVAIQPQHIDDVKEYLQSQCLIRH